VNDHLRYLSSFGIKNGAALVVENQTGKVRAYVGSQDFYSVRTQGQVDGVMAPRSTGSILKPFLYALCMDEGELLPQSILKDIPTHFGAFSPSNELSGYNGLVTVHEALVRSLNVPAVRVLNRYGLYRFYLFLRNAGITTLFRHADDYGLPLIIGGAEANLFELAAAYRGLARLGEFEPITIIERENYQIQKGPERLISRGACYMTLQILNDLKRPGAEYYWEQYNNQWPIAWKTGTSFGQRDAWAIGVTPEWTVAIWIGNFTGEGNANLKSGEMAGSLMLDIFNSLPKNPSLAWFQRPEDDLKKIEICSETGYLAGPDCLKTSFVDAPASQPTLPICPYHIGIYVDDTGEFQVCSRCWEPGHYKRESILVYTPDVMQFLRENGKIIPHVPPHNPYCLELTGTNPLQVIYPSQNARLWIPRDYSGALEHLVLRAAHRDSSQRLYWYIDGVYFGTTVENHVLPVELPKGAHSLAIVDSTGNRVQTDFNIDLKE
ncbi:MAG: hypothetical protein EHM28_10160, partial [Spirochaetaceae bacterium]